MAAYTAEFKPFLNGVLDSSKGQENLTTVQKKMSSTADSEAATKFIDDCCDKAKKKANNDVEKVRTKLHAMKPAPHQNQSIFKTWLTDYGTPAVSAVTSVLADFLDMFKTAARAIVSAIVRGILSAAKTAIGRFVVGCSTRVVTFFRSLF